MQVDNTTRVTLTLSPEQAQAVSTALDVYMRLCLGQLHIVDEMIRDERIPLYGQNGQPRQTASIDVCDEIGFSINEIKQALGYMGGASLGVGHRHVHETGIRSYEIMKVLDKVLAEHRNPTPEFRGVHYDGLSVRFTSDPAPEAAIHVRDNAEMQRRAFEIADRTSVELLASESMHCDEHGIILAVIGKNGLPIRTISDTPEHVQSAIEWLVSRGLATVVAGPEGDEVVVLSDGEWF